MNGFTHSATGSNSLCGLPCAVPNITLLCASTCYKVTFGNTFCLTTRRCHNRRSTTREIHKTFKQALCVCACMAFRQLADLLSLLSLTYLASSVPNAQGRLSGQKNHSLFISTRAESRRIGAQLTPSDLLHSRKRTCAKIFSGKPLMPCGAVQRVFF